MKPKSGDRFYSERSKTGYGMHTSSTSFHSSAFRKRKHQNQDKSLNLSTMSNKKSLSRLADLHITRSDLHQQKDLDVSELYVKTKILNEIFLHREEQIWEDLEGEELQLASLESNLNLLTKSVKILKDSMLASIADRCRPNVPKKSPSPGHQRLPLDGGLQELILQRDKNLLASEGYNSEIVSPKSATTNRLISILNPMVGLQAKSKGKTLSQNMSMDSHLRMNLSNPTITENQPDPTDQTASISSFKQLINSRSGKRWLNLYSGLEQLKQNSSAGVGPNVFVSRLRLAQEPSGRQNSQTDSSQQELLGSSSYRNLRTVLPSDCFLTHRELRAPVVSEAVGPAKHKLMASGLNPNLNSKSTIHFEPLNVSGLRSPRSPRVQSFLAKMEHLINPTGITSIQAKTQSDLQKPRQAANAKKESQTPKITTLKIAAHTVTYGPGKKPKPGLSMEPSTPAKPPKRHAAQDSAVAPLSVIEEHSTSQVGTVVKDSPRRAAGHLLYSAKRRELGSPHSRSRISAEHSQAFKKHYSQGEAGSEDDRKPLLMSVDTGSIPFASRPGKVEHAKLQLVQINDHALGPPKGISLVRSVEKRSHKLLFSLSPEDSESTQREKTSLQQGHLSDFEAFPNHEDPSISLSKRDLENTRKGSSPGIINNISPVIAREEFPQIDTSLEEQLIYQKQSYGSPKAAQFKLHIEKTDPVDKP